MLKQTLLAVILKFTSNASSAPSMLLSWLLKLAVAHVYSRIKRFVSGESHASFAKTSTVIS